MFFMQEGKYVLRFGNGYFYSENQNIVIITIFEFSDINTE